MPHVSINSPLKSNKFWFLETQLTNYIDTDTVKLSFLFNRVVLLF